MSLCRLCLKHQADKKGSHIVPHFLLKRIENIDGKKGRDYELGFTLGKGKAGSHFGRAVSPEKLEKVYGKVSDEDIAKNSHPLIVDYLFCSNCEKRLSRIESLYAESLNRLDNQDYESGNSALEGMTFWSSVIWRMSINGESGKQLGDSDNETLRKFINDNLIKDLDETGSCILQDQDLSSCPISFKLLRCYECSEKDARFLILHPDFDQPHILLIGEFILALSIQGDYDQLKSTNCFEINKFLEDSPINLVDGSEIIRPFDNKIYKTITDGVVERTKDEYRKELFEKLDLIHSTLGFGGELSKEIKIEILTCLAFEEEKIGRSYTDKEIARCAFRVLTKYYS